MIKRPKFVAYRLRMILRGWYIQLYEEGKDKHTWEIGPLSWKEAQAQIADSDLPDYDRREPG